MKDGKTLHQFWFHNIELTPAYLTERSAVWFGKNEAFDREVHDLFAPALDLNSPSELEAWKATPEGFLALILLYDQVPRNSFRGKPKSFAYDAQALALAQAGLGKIDVRLSAPERLFYYLPFEHAEDWETQVRGVECFRALVKANVGSELVPFLEENLDYAERHCEIIERFGRFPHRNEILGRKSTPEEIEFLRTPNSSF